MSKQKYLILFCVIVTVLVLANALNHRMNFSAGRSPFLYRLHKEKGGIWAGVGIENDYAEWKITKEEYKIPNRQQSYLTVVWRGNFRNTTDKKKQIEITFRLLDKDSFVISSGTRGTLEIIYLLPKENKLIEGELRVDKNMAPFIRRGEFLLSAKDVGLTKAEKEVADFARQHEDLEQLRPIMYELSLDPKNAGLSLQELYDMAKKQKNK